MDYSNRHSAAHVDGTPIFKSEKDEKNEHAIAELLSKTWRCSLHAFGMLSPIDWFAERDGRVIGILELKCRTNESTKHPTVFLNIRKWLALMLGQIGMGVPAIFVVQFTDSVRWIEISKVDSRAIKIGGWSLENAKAYTDIEPLIEVPVWTMHELTGKQEESQG